VDDGDARERVARIEVLLEEMEGLGDPLARDTATDLVQTLLELYGEGLTRMLACAGDVDAMARDEVVSHLLLLHGLHPVPVEERVRTALEEVRPYLGTHGGGVELLGVSDGIVHLRLEGTCDGCPSSAVTLKSAIEEAIRKAAPDIDDIEADGAVPVPTGLVELPLVCEIPR
jgi:Fe-S cluster biogenesis protein NfuA